MWVFVMINMAYADILAFMQASVLKQFLAGHAEQITITPTFILIAAIATEIPILMIVASRLLPTRINRWANIGAAVFTRNPAPPEDPDTPDRPPSTAR